MTIAEIGNIEIIQFRFSKSTFNIIFAYNIINTILAKFSRDYIYYIDIISSNVDYPDYVSFHDQNVTLANSFCITTESSITILFFAATHNKLTRFNVKKIINNIYII